MNGGTFAMVEDPNEFAQRQILGAIWRENPHIRPGQTFDRDLIRLRLKDTVTDKDFSLALSILNAIEVIGVDPAGSLVLTEKGFEVVKLLTKRSRRNGHRTSL